MYNLFTQVHRVFLSNYLSLYVNVELVDLLSYLCTLAISRVLVKPEAEREIIER